MKTRHPRSLNFPFLAISICLASWIYPQAQVLVGYTVVRADAGTALPVGCALFSYADKDGILVSQAGVAATQPMLAGRIFVDESGTQTGIALANVTTQVASIGLILRDSSGNEVARKSVTMEAALHMATFIFQEFPGLPAGFTGSLTFESDQRLAAITLRQSQNRRGDPLYTTLPVVDLASPANRNPAVFPQIAAGDGYVTQLLLINPGGTNLTGRIGFTDNSGAPLSLNRGDELISEFSYQIPPHGTYRAELDRSSGLVVGYAVVTPENESATPSGSAVFQFKSGASVVTEAGVGASPASSLARIFIDNVASYTGVAIASPGGQPVELFFNLLDSAGFSIQTVERTLPPGGHMAVFAHELFPGLADTFTGLMEIRSRTPVSHITLKLTINKRSEQVLTTLPVADLARPPTNTTIIFPQIAIGAGFSTRLIFMNSSSTSSAHGTISFLRSDGTGMTIPMAGISGNQFNYQIPTGGGRQYLPGNSAAAARVFLLDPATNAPASEVVVNEGNTIHARVLVIDIAGAPRDDFDVTYASISSDIATINANGIIQGKAAGFSTLTLSVGKIVTTGTITVVKVDSGTSGYEIQGIVQDMAGRLYLAAIRDQTILLAQDLKKVPTIYAGKSQQAGLKNDVRSESLFRNPADLSFNQAESILYVSDSLNHVVRRVQPGPTGKVDTLAGSGLVGSRDGTLKDAAFNKPGGVALDTRGYLWVTDSGNHTIRRIDLAGGTVETIAGKAGIAGNADGSKEQARFNAPAGIAVVTETIAQQLDRESKGLPPPGTSVIVADSGNGSIRRVKENGAVETIRTNLISVSGVEGEARTGATSSLASPIFSEPNGVAVDPSGNIFVSETRVGRLRLILQSGDVVPAVQDGTLPNPSGIAIAQDGKLFVSGGLLSAQQIKYGTPEISSIAPGKAVTTGGIQVTIRGKNFSRESVVIVAGVVMPSREVLDSETIRLVTPPLPSGLGTLTVQNRGGLAQRSFLIEPVPLNSMPPGYITTIAGGTTFIGDGGAPTLALLNNPSSIAVDASGNVFVADTANHRVRKISSGSRIITSVAGTGTEGFSGDGLPAIAANLNRPNGVAVDSRGNLFVADTENCRIRKVSLGSGIISTAAGNGQFGFSGDNGPANQAGLYRPYGVAINSTGDLYIADYWNNRVRKVSATSGIITTVAGNGKFEYSGDGGLAIEAGLGRPKGVAVDSMDNLYVADTENFRIRKVNVQNGIINTFAGTGTAGFSGDNGPALSSKLSWPYGMSFDTSGNLYFTDSGNQRIRKIATATGLISTVAGDGGKGYSGDDGPALAAKFRNPYGVGVASDGTIFVADSENRRIRCVTLATGIIATIAGTGETQIPNEGGPAASAKLRDPQGVAVDSKDNVFISDSNCRVWRVAVGTGIMIATAGTGEQGYSGDGGPATSAMISIPYGLAIDSADNLFLADHWNMRIRKVAAGTGIISTIAGGGSISNDGIPASNAAIGYPNGIAFDSAGNLYIAPSDPIIRKVAAPGGIISTVAGTSAYGFSGDGGPAILATIKEPYGVSADGLGNLYIADFFNRRVRKVAASTSVITTVAGGGTGSGGGIPATQAALGQLSAVAVDNTGNLFIAETSGAKIYKVAANTGIITTVAGTGVWGFSGDGGPAGAAKLMWPSALAIDTHGNLFVADQANHRIRAIRGPIP